MTAISEGRNCSILPGNVSKIVRAKPTSRNLNHVFPGRATAMVVGEVIASKGSLRKNRVPHAFKEKDQ